MTMDYTAHYDSPLGGITMVSDGEAFVGLWFDGQKYFSGVLAAEHEERETPVLNGAYPVTKIAVRHDTRPSLTRWAAVSSTASLAERGSQPSSMARPRAVATVPKADRRAAHLHGYLLDTTA